MIILSGITGNPATAEAARRMAGDDWCSIILVCHPKSGVWNVIIINVGNRFNGLRHITRFLRV